jgi:hypothetical protein
MKVSDRIKQLANYQIPFTISDIPDNVITNDIIAIFENGEGIEYVAKNIINTPFKFNPKDGDPNYRLILDEFGTDKVEIVSDSSKKHFPKDYPMLITEEHCILDFRNKKQYAFALPGRRYLTQYNSSSEREAR